MPNAYVPGHDPNAAGATPLRPFLYGATVTYACLPGYTGGGTIICQFHGQWSEGPTCIATGNNFIV